MTENTIGVGCGVLLFNADGQFLMMKRASKHGYGTYALPGGWMEFGETFESVAARESWEELGVEIDNIKVLGVSNNFFPAENRQTISIILGATLKSGTPSIMEPDKCSHIQWCDDWNNLPEPLFTNYNHFVTAEQVQSYIQSVQPVK